MGGDIDGEAAFDTLGMRNSVDLSSDGKILAVGSNENDGNGRNSGHVRAFEWTGYEWSQMGPDIEGSGAFDFAGSAVALNSKGHTMAVGAHARGTDHGHVRVYSFDRSAYAWKQKGKDIIGEEAYDYAGAAVDMNAEGDIIAVGAFRNGYASSSTKDQGHVRVYQWKNGAWNQLGGDIDGEELYGQSGVAVDLSADGFTLAIGAHENSVENSKYHAGHVRVYRYNGVHWNQLGGDINGEAQFDYSGSAIDLSDAGDIVAVGAYKNDGNGTDAGHVRMYKWASGMWRQMGQDLDGQAAYDNFGVSVDLASDGLTVAVGAWGNDEGGVNAGHARIYLYDTANNKWYQKGGAITGANHWDHSGSSVDISADGHTIAVGARYHSPSKDKRMAGQVKVYSTCAHLQYDDKDTKTYDDMNSV
jgi:hypothetical protein